MSVKILICFGGNNNLALFATDFFISHIFFPNWTHYLSFPVSLFFSSLCFSSLFLLTLFLLVLQAAVYTGHGVRWVVQLSLL